MSCSAALTRPSWASSEPVTFSGSRHVKRRPLLSRMDSLVAPLLSALSSAAGPCRSTATMYLGSVTSVENEGSVSASHTHTCCWWPPKRHLDFKDGCTQGHTLHDVHCLNDLGCGLASQQRNQHAQVQGDGAAKQQRLLPWPVQPRPIAGHHCSFGFSSRSYVHPSCSASLEDSGLQDDGKTS